MCLDIVQYYVMLSVCIYLFVHILLYWISDVFNCSCAQHYTALHGAVEQNKLHIVQLLVELGADIKVWAKVNKVYSGPMNCT